MAEALALEGAQAQRKRSSHRRAANASPGDVATQSRSIVLTIENMHCGGCMRKVEAALADMPGVAAARANLSARRVTVVSDDGSVTPDALVSRLADAGFKAGEVRGGRDDGTRAAERDLLVRVAVAGFAAANVMLLSVSVWSGDAGGDMSPAARALFHWLSALIALPAVTYAGQPFFRSAWSALTVRRLNMDVPISLGVLLATGMSLYLTIAGDGHIYFDAAVTLLFFLLIGRFLDMRMRTRAAGAASNLLALRAMSADVVGEDGTIRRLPAHALLPGMTVQAAPGERIAVDGTVASGSSEVDLSLITGESVPEAVAPGRKVYAGSINLSGRITVRADAVEDNTVLAEIARLMTAAEQGRSQYVRLADRAAAIYAPAVHILGFATFIGWILAGAGWQMALTTAIAVLIITCPCALALAVPAVQVAATSRLFDRGVIVKAADGLERLAACDTIVFDKTGTLTTGTPKLADLDARQAASLDEAARLAAASRHPYSRALVAAAEARGMSVVAADNVDERPGRGLVRLSGDGEVRLGSADHCGIDGRLADAATLWFRPAGDRDPVPFTFIDTLKPDAVEVVGQLAQAGYRIEILSGDRETQVAVVARELGVADYRAACSPADKVAHLQRLASSGRRVLMVGDGLNDGPALASGYASLSPSEASDVAQTSADAVFQGQGLAAVVRTLEVARATQDMALQNFAIALGYNLVFVPIAIAGFVTPLIAAIAMSASSIAVTANAVRLRYRNVALRRPVASNVGGRRS